eukprot:gene54683-20885_t
MSTHDVRRAAAPRGAGRTPMTDGMRAPYLRGSIDAAKPPLDGGCSGDGSGVSPAYMAD